MSDIVINYWSLNNVYIVITVLILIVLSIIYFVLFNKLKIQLSKELNRDCNQPFAIYFDKNNRDRCLTKKINYRDSKYVSQYLDTNVKKIEREIKKINTGVVNTNEKVNELNESTTLKSKENIVAEIQNSFNSVKNQYDTLLNKTNTTITNLETNINYTINILNYYGYNLLNTIIRDSVGDKKWFKRKTIEYYNYIIKYFNTVKKENIDKKLDNIYLNNKNNQFVLNGETHILDPKEYYAGDIYYNDFIPTFLSKINKNDNNYNIYYTPETSKFTITHPTTAFVVNASSKSSTINEILGLGKSDLQSSLTDGKQTIIFPNKVINVNINNAINRFKDNVSNYKKINDKMNQDGSIKTK